MGAGELQQEAILDNPVNAFSQKVATDMEVAKGSAELIAVNLLRAGFQLHSAGAKFTYCSFSSLKMWWIWQ